jgi:hypothetical protein
MADQEIHGRPVKPGQVHGRPVRGRSLYKESLCTFLPLGSNIWRRPHLLTHREETLSNEGEHYQRENTVEMICRPKQ